MTLCNLAHILITLCFSVLFSLLVLIILGRKGLKKRPISKESDFLLVENVDGR